MNFRVQFFTSMKNHAKVLPFFCTAKISPLFKQNYQPKRVICYVLRVMLNVLCFTFHPTLNAQHPTPAPQVLVTCRQGM